MSEDFKIISMFHVRIRHFSDGKETETGSLIISSKFKIQLLVDE